MKKILCIVAMLFVSSIFAEEELICESANYSISLTTFEDDSGYSLLIKANYGVNGKMNDQAIVSVDSFYKTERVVAALLNVDGKSGRFELLVTKKGTIYLGSIYSNNIKQNATCRVESVVTGRGRHDQEEDI